MNFKSDPRFEGIEPFKEKIWLSSPTMHGKELQYITEAYHTNWMSTVGENIDELERVTAEYIGVNYAVALSSGTAALHLAVRLAGEKLYGVSKIGHGALEGRKVFCSDMTFSATVNPVAYEGGEAIFIDTEYDTWNMNPDALTRAFEIYPDVKLVIIAHLYGIPGKIEEIKKICKEHNALMIEDAAESLGATYNGKKTGCFGDYGVISFNGNKIITGSSGGMFLCKDQESADKARKWSTQSRENALWYQHEEIGYNYRISNVVAGVARGQFEYLQEHIDLKQRIYMQYKRGFEGLPVSVNPYNTEYSIPNFWLSCLIIDEDAMCPTLRGEQDSLYIQSNRKSCPTELLELLDLLHAEGRPIWKTMHMQPIYRMNDFITTNGSKRGKKIQDKATEKSDDVSADIFRRGICLPSDIKMTKEQQEKIIEMIRRCFI